MVFIHETVRSAGGWDFVYDECPVFYPNTHVCVCVLVEYGLVNFITKHYGREIRGEKAVFTTLPSKMCYYRKWSPNLIESFLKKYRKTFFCLITILCVQRESFNCLNLLNQNLDDCVCV